MAVVGAGFLMSRHSAWGGDSPGVPDLRYGQHRAQEQKKPVTGYCSPDDTGDERILPRDFSRDTDPETWNIQHTSDLPAWLLETSESPLHCRCFYPGPHRSDAPPPQPSRGTCWDLEQISVLYPKQPPSPTVLWGKARP